MWSTGSVGVGVRSLGFARCLSAVLKGEGRGWCTGTLHRDEQTATGFLVSSGSFLSGEHFHRHWPVLTWTSIGHSTLKKHSPPYAGAYNRFSLSVTYYHLYFQLLSEKHLRWLTVKTHVHRDA